MDFDFDPDFNFGGIFQAYCDKCGRYYNPKTPHTCFPEDVNVEKERKKLKRYLDEYEVIE